MTQSAWVGLSLFVLGCSAGPSGPGLGDPSGANAAAGTASADNGNAATADGDDAAAACTDGTSQGCSTADGGPGVQFCDLWKPNSGGIYGPFWSNCLPAACTGSEVACVTAAGAAGVALCVAGQTASGCGVVDQCQPGDLFTTRECYTQSCLLLDDRWMVPPCNTPLVLAFHGEPVAFTHASGQFDLVGREASIATDWVGAGTPWLALDRNGNGAIDDGSELFGSMTELPDGTRAANGFAALAALDENRDGEITASDPGFARLLVWHDDNQDRQSSPDELVSAAAAGLVAIRLDYRIAPRCAGGDCEVERTRFSFRDAQGHEREGDVVDVHLADRMDLGAR